MNIFLLASMPLGMVLGQLFFKGPYTIDKVVRSLLPGLVLGALTLSLYWFFQDAWLIVWEFPGHFLYWWWGESLAFLIPVLLFQVFGSPWKHQETQEVESLTLLLGTVFFLLNVKDFFLTNDLTNDWTLFLLPMVRLWLVFAVPHIFVKLRHETFLSTKILLFFLIVFASLLLPILASLHSFKLGLWAYILFGLICTGTIFYLKNQE